MENAGGTPRHTAEVADKKFKDVTVSTWLIPS